MVNLKNGNVKTKTVRRMAVRSADRKVFESIVDGISKAIKEKPEDVICLPSPRSHGEHGQTHER